VRSTSQKTSPTRMVGVIDHAAFTQKLSTPPGYAGKLTAG
jgi:hypothetical protein